MRTLLLSAALCCAPIANAAIDGVYTGRLGNIEVVVELKQDIPPPAPKKKTKSKTPSKSPETTAPVTVTGRFAYLRHGVDIRLTGKQRPNGDWQLDETVVFPQKMPSYKPGTWILKDDMRGAWQEGDSTRYQKISLDRVGDTGNSDTVPSSVAEIKSSLYLWHKINQAFVKTSEVSLGNATYFTLTEPRSKFTYPRLRELREVKALDTLNAYFEEQQYLDLARFFVCQSLLARQQPVEHRQELEVHYFSAALLSMTVREVDSCDQRYYAQGGTRTETHDLLKGGRFDFRDYFVEEQREKYPADDIRGLARTLYIKQAVKDGAIKKAEDAALLPCTTHYADPKLEYHLALAEKGMMLRLNLPMNHECGMTQLLPYEQVNVFARPDSPYRVTH